jgi:hypothetical protein
LLLLKPQTFLTSSERLLRRPFLFQIVVVVFASILFFYTSAAAFQLTLAWDSNVEQDLEGYVVYYGTSSRNYQYNIDIGDETSCTISNLKSGKKYYFAVTAYDIEGAESWYSEEISYPNSVDSRTSNSDSDSGASASLACFISSAADGSWPTVRLLTLIGVLLAGIFGVLIYRRGRLSADLSDA